MALVDPSSPYRQAPRVLVRRVIDGTVVLAADRPDDGVRHLAGTAAEVWDLLAEPAGLADVVAELGVRYPDASAADVTADVTALVAELVDLGLVVADTP